MINKLPFIWSSPLTLWREKNRLRKKLQAESADYRSESKVLNTLALYWHVFLVLLAILAFALGRTV
ncbi:MAG: hypothetical protein AAB368_05240, partial [bacterium]